MKPNPINFQTAKAHAHFEGLWQYCEHPECRKRKQCTGGPRGTFRSTNGVPLCKQSDSQAVEKKRQHERRKQFGIEPDKTSEEPEWFREAMERLGLSEAP
ncbi:MAG: hypothetical protein QNJ29_14495 [Rhizobiaceae bacterium]|nr:hypothetical protein [Rhizobiaceae bacterium]